MPYFIGQHITEEIDGLWGEGKPYEKKSIYQIETSPPPVNYDLHLIKSHSLTHIESPRHTQKEGKTVDQYFDNLSSFWGRTNVLKLKGDKYKKIDKNLYLWEVQVEELKEAFLENNIQENRLEKLLLTTNNYYTDKNGYHDSNKILILSLKAAEFLVSLDKFNLYGTSWKSSDYQPGKSIRPIHNKLFEKALIMECLNLKGVPAGEYFLSAFPLPIKNASESPVTPVLFEKNEINF